MERISSLALSTWNKTMVTLKFYIWSVWNRLYYGDVCPVKIRSETLYVKPFDKRGYLIKHSNGQLQQNILRVWDMLLELNADYYLDVGANYGVFSLQSIKSGHETLSLEPNPNLAKCLKLSFATHDNSQVLDIAAHDTNQSEMDFFYTPTFSGTSSMANEVASRAKSSILQMWPDHDTCGNPERLRSNNLKTSHTTVESRRLSDLLPEVTQGEINSLVLKVDVEGFEPEVLEGGLDVLRECEWWRGIFEFNPSIIRKRGKSPKRTWKKFKEFPGFIIGKESATKKRLHDLSGHKLPEVPFKATDILIGQGKTP